ncbi:MAG TPA: GNAT family N-acetyltransferase [Acetobacteraceae bacterium]|nr:GNAT family N-acetyltransferase [Acetobacteraceae bacterium]
MTSIIRPGRDADADALIAVIAACWAMYPGVRMDVDGEMPELRALASYYGKAGGALWVAEDGGAVVGMAAVRPHVAGARRGAGHDAGPSNGWELCRVYVHPSQHGSGLGHALVDAAEAHAIAAGATRLMLWSDTRFDRAHRFYEKRSYVRAGPIRVLQDISHSLEFAYAKPVNGVEVLDAAGAASAERRLADILVACVDGGAGLSFLPPLAPSVARAYWKRVAGQVASGARILLCGWVKGVLSGAVMLDLGMPQDQQHRAEVKKLMVHPDARRRGLGRALMQRAEEEAVLARRSLLTLNARAGAVAEQLYRAMGWQEAGRVPGHTMTADGIPSDTLIFYKHAAGAALFRGTS